MWDGNANKKRLQKLKELSTTVKLPTLAAPQLGSCTSSGCAWRLWAARHSQSEVQPAGRPATASGARQWAASKLTG